MSSSQIGYHVPSFKPNQVSINLQTSTSALKWSKDKCKCMVPVAVNLYVDPKGYYLFCVNEITKETECFDIALIHDTRTGSQECLPRDCEEIQFDQCDVSLTSKWVSIYYGNTFVPDRDLRIIHFCFPSPAIAQEWAEQLFQYGHNPLRRNLSSLECLEKFHTEIVNVLVENRFVKRAITVQRLVLLLCKNTRDAEKEKKIRRALERLELPCKLDSVIDPEQFTFNQFIRFYIQLMERHEIDELLDDSGGKRGLYISQENVAEFIMRQNDAQDGDAHGKSYYEWKAKHLATKYAPTRKDCPQRGICIETFLRYLLSFDNLIVNPTTFDVFMEMNKPLAHYFIASSHNTYLTGVQWNGKASVEMYRQVLLTGCRCIELDVVDSEKNDEPEIKHRKTVVRSIPFKEVIIAIKECAFKVTPYPLILSIENHCNCRAQTKMAQYLVDIFGDSLITEPLKTHPCLEDFPLPSPNDLKYKILIKNKKLHNTISNVTNCPDGIGGSVCHRSSESCTVSPYQTKSSFNIDTSNDSLQSRCPVSEMCPDDKLVEFDSTSVCHKGDSTAFDGDEILASQDSSCPTNTTCISECLSNDDLLPESKATKAMSDLVHYTVPVRFCTFNNAEERKRSYEMSSFTEDRAQCLIRDNVTEFIAYNKRQLSRIYPRGTRLYSSNYNPYNFWPAGCQMVALNYQTLDVPMQINLALFSFNGGCGYLEKPAALSRNANSFDPFIQKDVKDVVCCDIDIKIISGQFMCQSREPTYVDVQLYGVYADMCKRRQNRLRAKQWNGFQALYDDIHSESGKAIIAYSKVILPEMALVHFIVSEEDGAFIGQSFLPVNYLRSGYRHIVLRNQINIPIQSASLFVFIRKQVHVDDERRRLVEKIVSPLSKQFCDADIFHEPKTRGRTNVKRSKFYRSHSVDDIPENRIKTSSAHFSTSVNPANSYQGHFISNSRLKDKDCLCKQLTWNDIQSSEFCKRERKVIMKKISNKLRADEKKIEREESQFQRYMEEQYSNDKVSTQNIKLKQVPIKASANRLLFLYSVKFRNQIEIENYYSPKLCCKLESYVHMNYDKQMENVNTIFYREKDEIKKHIRMQAKKSTNVEYNKNPIPRLSYAVCALINRRLEEMRDQLIQMIKINRETTLNSVRTEIKLETKNRLDEHLIQFNTTKVQLQHAMHGSQHGVSREALLAEFDCSPIDANVSLSTMDCPRQMSMDSSIFHTLRNASFQQIITATSSNDEQHEEELNEDESSNL